jgi:hypothetical protein
MHITTATSEPQVPYRHRFGPLADAPPPQPPRVWPVGIAFVAAVALALVFSVVVLAIFLGLVLYDRGTGPQPSPRDIQQLFSALASNRAGLLGSGLASGLSFAFVALMAANLSPVAMRDRLRLHAHPWWFAWGMVTTIGMLGIGAFSSGVVALLGLEGTGNMALIHRAFAGAPVDALVTGVAIVNSSFAATCSRASPNDGGTPLPSRSQRCSSVLCTSIFFTRHLRRLSDSTWAG